MLDGSMGSDLRVFLRYGIVGYMVLFFDLVFACSYVDLETFLNHVRNLQLGIIIGIMGLPMGWLCYQLWDQFVNRVCIPRLPNIKKIREWEKSVRDQLKIKKNGKQVNKELRDHTIKVIANISLGYLKENDQKGSSTIRDDPRSPGRSVYSHSLQARGVMCFVLPCATYSSYVVIAIYMVLKFGWFYVFNPMDTILCWIVLLLPVPISLISCWGFCRVCKEQGDYGWAILSDKEDQIKELIKKFYDREDKPGIQ